MLSPAARAPIEPGILPVCKALNAIGGIQTVWSCEGHPWRLVLSKPYVMFTAPQDFAFRLHLLLLSVDHTRAYLEVSQKAVRVAFDVAL